MKNVLTISIMTMFLISCGEDEGNLAQFALTDKPDVSLSEDGKDGSNGKNGLSCSVVENEDEPTARIECEDGTSAIITNGKNGKDGKDGKDGKRGAKGEKGDKGDKGDQGDQGLAGTDGVNGEDGEDGTDGINGSNGSNGSDGSDGADGRDGVDGSNGLAGVDGNDGADGADGVNGTNGTNGADGADGADGQDGQDGADGVLSLPMVEDSNGLELGRLVFMDASGSFAVLMSGGLRAKVGNNGHIETLRTYFAGAGCTGERRAVIVNGDFGNFNEDHFAGDGSYWKINSNNLGSFTYLSREDGDGICDSVGGTIASGSHTITTGLNLGFTLPFGMWPRIKDFE